MAKQKQLFTGPWYPWYVNAARDSENIDAMSLTEEAAYRRALDYEWMKGSVPADPAKCASTAIKKRCTVKTAEVVLKMFVPMPGDSTRMVNLTLEKVRKEQELLHKKKSRAGKIGMQKRWKRSKETTSGDNSVITQPNKRNIKEKKLKETKDKKDISRNLSAVESLVGGSPQEKNAAPPRRGTRIPEPFMLTQKMREWAGQECPQVDVQTETKKFVNHWRAKTGKDATKLDWPGTWENWMYNARDRYGANRNGSGNSQNRTSEREKSADRGANAEEFADKLDQLAESRGAALPGDDGSSGAEVHQLGEQPFVN